MKEKKPSIMFLMETKSKQIRMERIRVKCGFSSVFVVDPIGRSSELTVLWKDECDLEIQNFSRRHINAIVKQPNVAFEWKLTGFYGYPESEKHF